MLGTPAFRRALPVHVLLGSPPHARLSASPHLSPHIVYALLVTRQDARAFNQPLSFETSKVTTMEGMLAVRSSRVLRPDYSRAFPNPRDMPSAAHGSYTPTSYFARPLHHAPPF